MLACFTTKQGRIAIPVGHITMVYEQSATEVAEDEAQRDVIVEGTESVTFVSVNDNEGYQIEETFEEACAVINSAFMKGVVNATIA